MALRHGLSGRALAVTLVGCGLLTLVTATPSLGDTFGSANSGGAHLSSYDRADLPAEFATSGAADYLHKEELGPAAVRRLWDEHGHRRTVG